MSHSIQTYQKHLPVVCFFLLGACITYGLTLNTNSEISGSDLTGQAGPNCGNGIPDGGEQCDLGDPDLIAYYPMHGGTGSVVADYSLNNHHAQLSGVPLWLQNGEAKMIDPNGGIDFDGGDDYMDLGNHEDFNFGFDSFSVAVWVYYEGNKMRLFSKGNAYSEYEENVNSIDMGTNEDGTLYFFSRIPDSLSKNIAAHNMLTTTSIALSEGWHHVAFVRDKPTNAKKIYVDGVEVASNTHNFKVENDRNAVVMAHEYYDNAITNEYVNGFLPGSIDDLRIYSKALTASDISTLASGRDARDCNEDCTNRTDQYCGNATPEAHIGEECDTSSNSNTTPNACRIHCFDAVCGDGVQDSGEQCDSGDIDLIAYYPMHKGYGNVMEDHSRNTLDAQLVNGPLWKQSTPARSLDLNGGIEFDGGDDYANLGNSDLFNFGYDDFSISVWVYYEGNTMRLYNKGESESSNYPKYNNSIGLMTRQDGSVRFTTKNFNNHADSGRNHLDTSSVLSDDTWHHIVITRDDFTNEKRIYVDGVERAKNAHSFMVFNEREVIVMGSKYKNTGNADNEAPFNQTAGSIDDLRVYSKRLSDTEVTDLFNQGRDATDCTAQCQTRSDEMCGNTNTDTNLQQTCDDGTGVNSDTEPNTCRAQCHLPACGDGVIDDQRGEVCDRGEHDLIAYYPMHEGVGGTAHDYSWGGNDATLENGPIWKNSAGAADPHALGGLEFDGVDDYLDMGNSELFNFGHDDFTIMAWVKYTGSQMRVFTKGWSGKAGTAHMNSLGFWVYENGSIGFLTKKIRKYGNNDHQDFISDPVLTADTWHHVAISRNDNDNRKKIYVDGALIDETTNHDFIVFNAARALSMGIDDVQNVRTVWVTPGSIDDLRVYRRLLSDAEVAQMATYKEPLTCDPGCSSDSFCGDGTPDELLEEDCDEGGDTPTCDGDCSPVECGDNYTNPNAIPSEECDEGSANAVDGSCTLSCTVTYCGDGEQQQPNGKGFVTGGAAFNEDCDDAGDSVNCDQDCTPNECGDGYTNSNTEQCDTSGDSATCDDDCSPVVCGDGYHNTVAEQCEPGIVDCSAGAACNATTCQCEASLSCGDGSVTAPETCDDSDPADGVDDALCRDEGTLGECTYCGDAQTQIGAGEDCDTAGDSATCNADCSDVQCGDGYFNSVAEQCEPGVSDCSTGFTCNTSSCQCEGPACGDGLLNGLETCDDSDPNDAVDDAACRDQGAADECTFCGDTQTQTGSEECDDGSDSVTCDADCTAVVCGDGYLNPVAEECGENGATCSGSDTCNTTTCLCESPLCGNSAVDTADGESCDESDSTDPVAPDVCRDPGTAGECTYCGDGVEQLSAGETCDTGGDSATCDRDCTVRECGDGYPNTAGGEQCDDGKHCSDGTQCAANADCTGVGDGSCEARDGDGCSAACITEFVASSSVSSQPEFHSECSNNKCRQVEGPGTDECSVDTDCRDDKNYTACFRFECVVVAGQGDDQCTEHAHCLDDYHTICEDNQCKFVGGEGTNECIDDDQCIPDSTDSHGECIQNQCVRIAGPGPDECIHDDDCSPAPPHTECRNDQCIMVDGEGVNECVNDSDCLEKGSGHTECRDEQCISVDASGFDECINDSDCFVIRDTHTECQDDQCVSVEGAGSNECINDADCEARALGHTQCQDNQCIVIAGSGTDQCINHSDCDPTLTTHHTVCEDNACIAKEGSGTNQCINDSDCTDVATLPPVAAASSSAQSSSESSASDSPPAPPEQSGPTHGECHNNQCISVPGEGLNFCTRDLDCLVPHHSECQPNLCLLVPGEGKNECARDVDCIDVLSTQVAASQICGDGIIQYPEECDDSNSIDGDGCSSICTKEHVAVCGNSVVEVDEQCDDGNLVNGDGCSVLCLEEYSPVCGNSIIDSGEECDLGSHNSDTKPNACRTNCTLHTCGDSVTDLDEECDDGNRNDNDDCSNACTNTKPIPDPDQDPDPLKPSAPQPIIAHQPTASTIPFNINQQLPTSNNQPSYRPLAYQVPITQYQIPQRPPIGDTGPATAAVIAMGSALGYSIHKRKQVN